MSRKVELITHDPEWLRQFEEEAARLTAVFQPNFIAIHHIGSTAVPGIKAKPIIDIMIVVRDIEQVDIINESMGQIGYIAKGENGIDGRRYFRKGSDRYHTHHVHTYQDGHPEISRHLNFRDYLIAHPEVAQAYSRLKEELAQKYVTEPPRYTNSKTDFIREVEANAAVWRNHQAIETEQVVLRPLTMNHLQTSLTNRPQLTEELGVPLADGLFSNPVPQAIGMKLEKMAQLHPADHPWATYWLVIPKEMPVGAGLAGFKGYPDETGAVEIGYGMHPDFQNKGYMTAAVQALVAWALERPECTAVTAETEIENQYSIRVLERVGMQQIGRGNGRILWRKS